MPTGRKPATRQADAAASLIDGMWVISVYGPFNNRVLVDMSYDRAAELFGSEPLASVRSARVVDAVLREIERIRERDPVLADGPLAASMVSMAVEIEHPFNSATAKANCQARLAEAQRELRELLPPEVTHDSVDEIAAARDRRRDGSATPPPVSRTKMGDKRRQ